MPVVMSSASYKRFGLIYIRVGWKGLQQ